MISIYYIILGFILIIAVLTVEILNGYKTCPKCGKKMHIVDNNLVRRINKYDIVHYRKYYCPYCEHEEVEEITYNY